MPEGPPPAPVNVKLAIIPANTRVDNNSPTFTSSYDRNSVCMCNFMVYLYMYRCICVDVSGSGSVSLLVCWIYFILLMITHNLLNHESLVHILAVIECSILCLSTPIYVLLVQHFVCYLVRHSMFFITFLGRARGADPRLPFNLRNATTEPMVCYSML